MEIVAIASVFFFIKVLICTLLQNCKTVKERVKKEIVKIDEKISKETEQNTKSDFAATESSELTTAVIKKNPPRKPPRTYSLYVKPQSMEKSDNTKDNLQEAISPNNVHSKTFLNDDYIRSKVYKVNQHHWTLPEKEARFREAYVQTERHSNNTLLTSNEPPSSEIDIESKSVPHISELTKLLQLRFLMMNSSESKSSQYYSKEIIENNETNFMNVPNKLHKEMGKNYPFTSTKIRSKNSTFYKLRKYLTAGLYRIFNQIKSKC